MIENYVKNNIFEETLILSTDANSIFLGRDVNEHAGEARQFSGAHGGFGFGRLNEEGQTILDFTMAYDFRIMIKKHEEH